MEVIRRLLGGSLEKDISQRRRLGSVEDFQRLVGGWPHKKDISQRLRLGSVEDFQRLVGKGGGVS